MNKPPCRHFFILSGHEAVPVDDAKEWGAWFETAWPARMVKQTTLKDGTFISTVFLGIDHSFGLGGLPQIFESMVFAPKKAKEVCGEALEQQRCSTWEEAEQLHEEMVKLAESLPSARAPADNAPDNAEDNDRQRGPR